jgi:hypothetical protein
MEKPLRVVPGKVTVEVAMIKKLSWADKSKVTEQSLLYHQTTFDLYELYARKLRKKCSEKGFGLVDPGSVWQSYVDAVNAELELARRHFETETQMGLNLLKLQEWSTKLSREIKELDSFKGD